MYKFDGEINGKLVSAKRLQHSGRRIYWRCESTELLTDQEVAEVQIKLGYHPNGYGGPHGINRVTEITGHVVGWYCFDNCD